VTGATASYYAKHFSKFNADLKIAGVVEPSLKHSTSRVGDLEVWKRYLWHAAER
jgi:hypothetical protein